MPEKMMMEPLNICQTDATEKNEEQDERQEKKGGENKENEESIMTKTGKEKEKGRGEGEGERWRSICVVKMKTVESLHLLTCSVQQSDASKCRSSQITKHWQ
jgi:hypothetical protein